MENSKLFRLLKLLSKTEFKEFGLFLRSPYHNRLNNVTRLYDLLKKHYPYLINKNLTKEYLYSKIFPGKKYNDIQMRALQSHMFSLAEKFIAINAFEKDPLDMRLKTASYIRKKGEAYLMSKNAVLARSLLDKIRVMDSDYYHSMYSVAFEENYVANHFSSKRDFQKEADALTAYYLISALRTYGTAFNRKSSLHIDMDTKLAETIEHLAHTEPYSSIPAVEMNLALYMIARYMDEKHFFRFLTLMEKHTGVFKKDELYDAQYFLVNFCVLKIQQGDKRFVKIKLGLYKNILEGRLWEGEGYLSYVIFNNAITSAIENNDFSFAEIIIKEYQSELEPGMKNDMVELSSARLKYCTKSYDEALTHLSRINLNDDVFYKFAIKDLYIKIYYELGHYESIFSSIDSYKHFLHSNKLITNDVKKRYGLFLNMLNDIVKIKLHPTEENIKSMRENLLTTEGFVNKDWLAEKLLDIS